MRFFIHEDVLAAFPDALVGVIEARGVDNREAPSAELVAALREAQSTAVRAIGDAPVAEHPNIACWREAYRGFGAKPKKYPSSIENLVRRAAKNEPLRSINKLVDVYNVVSLTHLLPCGGEDLDAISGDIRLMRAAEDEPDVVLLGEKEGRPPQPGEVIYRDDLGAICRRWNWKEADRTKLTEATRNAVLVIEALPPVSVHELEEGLNFLGQEVRRHVGGRIACSVLSRSQPGVLLGG